MGGPTMASKIFIFLCRMLLILLSSNTIVEAVVGINWGRQTPQRLIPSMVVDMLLQNNIREMKIFTPSASVMEALMGSGIGLTITIPNEGLWPLTHRTGARHWVKRYVTLYHDEKKVAVRYVNVGLEPFSKAFRSSIYPMAFQALKEIQKALNNDGYLGKVKATIPHFTDVLIENITKPSQAEFRPDIRDRMVEHVRFIDQNGAPFTINIFPIYYIRQREWDLEFAFSDNKSNFTIVDDNGLRYTNVFDFLYDSVLWALMKAGVPQMKLVVGQVGWPTDGYPGANAANAERFYRALLPIVTSNRGTPLRPGTPIDVYLHSLTDENKLRTERGTYQRHWGIFSFDGTPKYKIDFTGKGRNIFPSVAKGVTYLPRRWCIFDGDTDDDEAIRHLVEDLCTRSDCTSLAPGGSCSHLDFKHNVSYVFNMMFQDMFQKKLEEACDFKGHGKIVTENPSTGTCVFPVQILAADEVVDGGKTTMLFGTV